ncbi:glutathione S-transferase family protein [Moraxella sp. ZY210820]|uniref:glutathione S-transferase family protein n=1 Tax=unclassified Moraxella TaxID=2685852 RepID=UPI0027300302|nr:glutathione S-transferase family protein [Moraxella sp. ZY210820]WLF83326.1 glutathione S-transferase family protein [Moraxella sp. ZY210820]
MITLYNLENSRSQRISWLLEELGVDYQIKEFKRDPNTRLAPAELRQIHPLGKAPVIDDSGVIVAESGAIMQYLLYRYGGGRLEPDADSPDYAKFLQWLHYAEGSAMVAFGMKFLGETGGSNELVSTFTQSQFDLHTDYIENSLNGKKWLLGDDLTAADMMMSYPLQYVLTMVEKGKFPNIERVVAQIQNHPSYQKACERAGAVH